MCSIEKLFFSVPFRPFRPLISLFGVPIHHVYTISFTLLRCLGVSLLSIEYIPVALAKWYYQFGYYAAVVDEHCSIRSEMSGFQMEQQNRHRWKQKQNINDNGNRRLQLYSMIFYGIKWMSSYQHSRVRMIIECVWRTLPSNLLMTWYNEIDFVQCVWVLFINF